jgi:hypothetical protein
LPYTALSAHSQVFARKEENLEERVGFEPRLSNEINKLEGANGTSNPLNFYKDIQLHVPLDA